MTDAELESLLEYIDRLVDDYIEHKPAPRQRLVNMLDRELYQTFLEKGLYPPDDPTSASRRSMHAIGETLGRVGGKTLMDRVVTAYAAKFGNDKANKLIHRWDAAAGIWYN